MDSAYSTQVASCGAVRLEPLGFRTPDRICRCRRAGRLEAVSIFTTRRLFRPSWVALSPLRPAGYVPKKALEMHAVCNVLGSCLGLRGFVCVLFRFSFCCLER